MPSPSNSLWWKNPPVPKGSVPHATVAWRSPAIRAAVYRTAQRGGIFFQLPATSDHEEFGTKGVKEECPALPEIKVPERIVREQRLSAPRGTR